MDPLSVLASTLGIASAAVQSVNTLIHDINAIKDAPDLIADLRDELTAVKAVLMAINNAQEGSQLENLSPDSKKALQLAVTNCEKACDKFRLKLDRWTRHSDDKIHWWDRVRIGLFAEGTIEALSDQLDRYKSTMNTAVSTATLISTAAKSTETDAVQIQLEAKEMEISQDMIELDEQDEIVGRALQKFTKLSLAHNGNSGSVEVIEQLQDQRATLDDSRKLLEDLLAEAHQIRTGHVISKIDMSDGGRLLVGLINCDNSRGEIRQEIHDVKASNNGKGIVGIAKGIDVNTFLND